jgi:hypothetical protein
MNTTPWWVNTVAILATGTISIVASVIATKQSSKHAEKRLKVELEHQRELELMKLLHGKRYELYNDLYDVVAKLDKLSGIFDPWDHNLTRDKANQAHIGFSEAFEELGNLRDRMFLIASVDGVHYFNDYYTAVFALVAEVENLFETLDRSEVRSGFDSDVASKFQVARARLNGELRDNLGVVEPSKVMASRRAAQRRLQKLQNPPLWRKITKFPIRFIRRIFSR